MRRKRFHRTGPATFRGLTAPCTAATAAASPGSNRRRRNADIGGRGHRDKRAITNFPPELSMIIRSHSRVLFALALAQSALTFADPPTTSPYATDAQNSHVEDATSRGIGQVNMITCIMGAMRPDALVNDGAYNALVDKEICDPGSRSSGDSASEAVQSTTFLTSTVNSTRASNSDPMRARIWIDDPETEGAAIFVNMSASAPPTASNPYGVFRVDYCGNMPGSP